MLPARMMLPEIIHWSLKHFSNTNDLYHSCPAFKMEWFSWLILLSDLIFKCIFFSSSFFARFTCSRLDVKINYLAWVFPYQRSHTYCFLCFCFFPGFRLRLSRILATTYIQNLFPGITERPFRFPTNVLTQAKQSKSNCFFFLVKEITSIFSVSSVKSNLNFSRNYKFFSLLFSLYQQVGTYLSNFFV